LKVIRPNDPVDEKIFKQYLGQDWTRPGIFIGVYVACDWFYPTSNLCGIYGVFSTGPIGLSIGAVLGWRIS
jgi:hypothetical protein